MPERKAVQELPGNSLVTRVGGANVSLASPLSRVVANSSFKSATAGDHSTTAQRSVASMIGSVASVTKATKMLGDTGCDMLLLCSPALWSSSDTATQQQLAAAS